MSSFRTLSLAVLAVVALAIAGCTVQEPDVTPEEQVGAEQRPDPEDEGDGEGNGEGGSGGETLTFTAVDIEFEEAPTEAPAGSVTIELVNDGSANHDVTIEELDETVVEAAGGETATGTIDLEPGEYNYFCSVPGHESSMSGTFTVS